MNDQEESKPQRVHVIPVGHPEPLHEAGEGCWCKPLLKENGAMAIHNAKDCREKWERQGILDRDKQWILAYENLKEPLPNDVSPSPHPLTIDLAMIRWSVACNQWGELSAGHAPDLGSFIAGWFCRCSGFRNPPRDNHRSFQDSFCAGWREADAHISIDKQKKGQA